MTGKKLSRAVQGDGLVVSNGDQLVGRSLIVQSPLTITNPHGIGGSPVMGIAAQTCTIASLDVDQATHGDEYHLPVIGVDTYIIRRVIVMGIRGAVAEAFLSIYTRPDRRGLSILEKEDLSGLDGADPLQVLEWNVNLGRGQRAPVLYVCFDMDVDAEIALDVFVVADVLRNGFV